jgi:peptide methionine sulfoxide reductase MsrA
LRFNLFQKVLASLGLLAIVVLLAGCPFSSTIPIDEGTVKVSSELAGQWISSADKDSENPSYYVITKDDKTHATAKKMEYSSSDSSYSETIYQLTFSDVNGEVFMNALENEGANYYLFKFKFDEKANEIYTSEVTDYIKETFSTSAELKDFIAKNKSNSYFYTNTSDTYVRK